MIQNVRLTLRGSSFSRFKNFSLPQNLGVRSGAHRPPIQWLPATLSLDVRWHGCEADLSPRVRMLKAVPPLPDTRLHGEHRKNFTFFVYLILNAANFVSEISKSTELYDSVRGQYFSF